LRFGLFQGISGVSAEIIQKAEVKMNACRDFGSLSAIISLPALIRASPLPGARVAPHRRKVRAESDTFHAQAAASTEVPGNPVSHLHHVLA
jgi:hypothetical protein